MTHVKEKIKTKIAELLANYDKEAPHIGSTGLLVLSTLAL